MTNSTHLARVVGLQTDAVVVTQTRFYGSQNSKCIFKKSFLSPLRIQKFNELLLDSNFCLFQKLFKFPNDCIRRQLFL